MIKYCLASYMIFSIEKTAREYVNKRFPRASVREREKIIADWVSKVEDSKALTKDFEDRVGKVAGKKILDAGSGPGGVSIAFALAGAEVSGVDIEKELYEISKAHAEAYGAKAKFFLYDGTRLPFPDNEFDYVVSVSVLEHTDDPKLYLSELLRVTKPGGKCYLAFPNKLWPKETHTGIWFLTYLPVFLRQFAVSFLGRNPLEENNLNFYTYFDLKRMLKNIDSDGFSWHLVSEDGKTKKGIKKVTKDVLGFFGLSYKAFLSHILVILEKK